MSLPSQTRVEKSPQGTRLALLWAGRGAEAPGAACFDGVCSPSGHCSSNPITGRPCPGHGLYPAKAGCVRAEATVQGPAERQALPGKASQSPIRGVHRQMKRRARHLTPGPHVSASDLRATPGLDAIVMGTWL